MDEELNELIEGALHRVLDARRSISSDDHADHHTYIRVLIEREEARRDMYRKLAISIIQWSITGILGIVITKVFTGHWPFGA